MQINMQSAWTWAHTHWHIIAGAIVALVILGVVWAIVKKVERVAVKVAALCLAPILTGFGTTVGLGWLSHNFPVGTTSQTTSTTQSSSPEVSTARPNATESTQTTPDSPLDMLAALPIKAPAPMAGYDSSDSFWDMWITQPDGCDTRNMILARDLTEKVEEWGAPCYLASGTLMDPYSGTTVHYQIGDGPQFDGWVQIDHVVSLSNAWATGAANWTAAQRSAFANDPSELLGVWSGQDRFHPAKGDGDAATWLPSNKDFRCQYVTIQIQVKTKYSLWVTQAEHDAMQTVLQSC